jgi:hypothetical protein
MSHSHLTTTSSSNFQLILNDALKAYQKLTKRDLLTHPLASELQACDSPTAILAVLQQHVQGLDQSRSGEDRWTKWLYPTVKVLYIFSSTLEERVGLVSLSTRSCIYALSDIVCMAGVTTCKSDTCRSWCPSISASSLCLFAINITPTSHRRLRMFGEVKIHSLGSLSALKVSSAVSRSTRKYRRLRE